jgi:aquaporin Z
MVMIFAGGHVSGAHYNPAVALAVFIRGRCDSKDVVPYWVAQLAAGVAAALVAVFLVGKSGTPMEIKKCVTGFCGGVSFHVCPRLRRGEFRHSQGTSGNSFYGLAIGMTVMVGAFSVRAISGGAFKLPENCDSGRTSVCPSLYQLRETPPNDVPNAGPAFPM